MKDMVIAGCGITQKLSEFSRENNIAGMEFFYHAFQVLR